MLLSILSKIKNFFKHKTPEKNNDVCEIKLCRTSSEIYKYELIFDKDNMQHINSLCEIIASLNYNLFTEYLLAQLILHSDDDQKATILKQYEFYSNRIDKLVQAESEAPLVAPSKVLNLSGGVTINNE